MNDRPRSPNAYSVCLTARSFEYICFLLVIAHRWLGAHSCRTTGRFTVSCQCHLFNCHLSLDVLQLWDHASVCTRDCESLVMRVASCRLSSSFPLRPLQCLYSFFLGIFLSFENRPDPPSRTDHVVAIGHETCCNSPHSMFGYNRVRPRMGDVHGHRISTIGGR